MLTSWLVTLAFCAAPIAGNTAIGSFEHAKRELVHIYQGHQCTLYSNCAYTDAREVDYGQCAYRPRRDNPRAHRIEWEHVVPAEAFGQSSLAWRQGHPLCRDSHGRPFAGRRCAARADTTYRRMEADLYNLYPEIGEINRLRSNFSMAEIAEDTAQLASLPIKVGHRKFEPRPGAKGDVARTYLYMEAAYPGRGIISGKNAVLFSGWDAQDPVDAWECQRALRIELLQGNANPYVMRPCLAQGLIAQAQRRLPPFADTTLAAEAEAEIERPTLPQAAP
jgi:deoxyribonuclease-1